MPCGGPSKEFAIIKSQEAHDKIIQMLKEEYQVYRPVPINNLGVYKKWQEDWDKEEAALREALTELFWTSDCSSF